MSETFGPSRREDGTFDPDYLEQAGQRWVTAWLKMRLSGRDPYFPIDRRGGEDPESLIVAILRDAGSVHPAYSLIACGILDLLDGARKLAPETPAYLESALQICERVRLPLTSTWFTEELRDLGTNQEASERRWGTRLIKEILHGAILQSPGLPSAASYASWQAILKLPRYATLAWMGLAPTFAASVDLMEAWWQSCPAPQRQAEIDQLIFTGLKTEGTDQVRELLTRRSKSWSATLRAAAYSALANNGVKVEDPVVVSTLGSRDLESVIEGAARRRKIVLRVKPQEEERDTKQEEEQSQMDSFILITWALLLGRRMLEREEQDKSQEEEQDKKQEEAQRQRDGFILITWALLSGRRALEQLKRIRR